MGKEDEKVEVPEELKNVGEEQEPSISAEEEEENAEQKEEEPSESEEQRGEEQEGEEEEDGESTGEEGKEDKENMVPQSRFDEIYRRNKEYEERLKTLEEQESAPPITVDNIVGQEIGGVSVKEILALTPEQSEKLDEWYEKDPLSAQAWVNQKVSDKRRAYEHLVATQNRHKRSLMKAHPDMYKRDANGQLVFDPESPKGKIFNEIAEANRYLLDLPDGPKIARLMLEERLGGKKMVKKSEEPDAQKEKTEAGKTAAEQKLKPKPISSKGTKTVKAAPTKLSPDEKRVAAKFHMSEEEYVKYKQPIQGAY